MHFSCLRPLVPVLALLAFASPVRATAPPAEAPGLEARVDAFLKPLVEADLISGTVLIAQKGQILLAKGYGPANREHGIPCVVDTKFRLASLTKQFTAACILLLEERGKLSVQDPLAKYLPDYPSGDRITLHHLLTHTSGVVNYSGLPDMHKTWAQPLKVPEVIALFRDRPLGFEPGTRFAYSNSGYVLLTAVIEKVSGQSYGAFLRENILKPLGMRDTGLDDATEILPGRATGHYNGGERITQAPYLFAEFTSGAGAMYSTVRDLHRWDRALYGDGLLSEASRRKLFTPNLADYGYGWFIREEHGRRLIEHRGGLNGFLTQIQRFVDDEILVVTLFNYVSTFVTPVNRGLAALALGLPVEPAYRPEGVPLPPESLRPLAGRYLLQKGYVLEVSVEGGRLFLTTPDLKKAEARPQAPHRFFVKQGNALLNFEKSPDGSVSRLVLQQGEKVFPCPREKN